MMSLTSTNTPDLILFGVNCQPYPLPSPQTLWFSLALCPQVPQNSCFFSNHSLGHNFLLFLPVISLLSELFSLTFLWAKIFQLHLLTTHCYFCLFHLYLLPCISILKCYLSHLAIVPFALISVDSNVTGSLSRIYLNPVGVCIKMISKLLKWSGPFAKMFLIN